MQQIKSSNEVIIAQQIQGGFFTDIINRTYWLPVVTELNIHHITLTINSHF
jgi:hypothetical protein